MKCKVFFYWSRPTYMLGIRLERWVVGMSSIEFGLLFWQLDICLFRTGLPDVPGEEL